MWNKFLRNGNWATLKKDLPAINTSSNFFLLTLRTLSNENYEEKKHICQIKLLFELQIQAVPGNWHKDDKLS